MTSKEEMRYMKLTTGPGHSSWTSHVALALQTELGSKAAMTKLGNTVIERVSFSYFSKTHASSIFSYFWIS